MDIWYYALNGAQQGPISQEALAHLITSGQLPADSLVWREGMSDWIPARTVPELAAVANQQSPMVQPVVGYGIADSSSYNYSNNVPVQYAGFWLRFAAWFIDRLVMLVPGIFFGAIIGGVMGAMGAMNQSPNGQPNPSAAIGMNCSIQLVVIVIEWLYFAFMESSNKMATLGKMACGLKVTDYAGQKLSFGQASGRYFGKIVSGLTLCVGFMMAGWTEKKQALHDMMASTLVVRK